MPKTAEEPAEVLADRLAEAERVATEAEPKAVVVCVNCEHPIGNHGGMKGWVCRGTDEGPDGPIECSCTEWIDPRQPAEEAEDKARTAQVDTDLKQADQERDRETRDQVTAAMAAVTPQPVDEPVDEVSTDLEPVQTLPQLSAWQTIQGMAVELAKSNLVPSYLRGKPADVQVILLAAHDLGITATQALWKIYVIDGKPSMAAELMVALVQRSGHKLDAICTLCGRTEAEEAADPKCGPEHCEITLERGAKVRGTRSDGSAMSFRYTLDDAVQAGLCTIGQDGKPRARSQSGARKPWETAPRSMMWARAVAQLCRMQFADVLAGVSYVPEELGYIEAEGDEVAPGGAQGAAAPTPEQAADDADFALGEEGRKAVVAAIAKLPEDRKASLREEWGLLAAEKKLRLPTKLRASELEAAWEIVHRYTDAEPGAHTGPIEEAEIVQPEEAADPPAEPFTCPGCTRIITPPDAESKHAPGCTDAPF